MSVGPQYRDGEGAHITTTTREEDSKTNFVDSGREFVAISFASRRPNRAGRARDYYLVKRNVDLGEIEEIRGFEVFADLFKAN